MGMQVSRTKINQILQEKRAEYTAFTQRVNQILPTIETMLNSAFKAAKVRSDLSIALSDRWLIIEDPQTNRYCAAMFELMQKPESTAIADQKPLYYHQAFSNKVVTELISLSAKNDLVNFMPIGSAGKISGFRFIDVKTGLVLDVAKKSTVNEIIEFGLSVSYVVTEGGKTTSHFLRKDEELMSHLQIGPNYERIQKDFAFMEKLHSRIGLRSEAFPKAVEASVRELCEKLTYRLEKLYDSFPDQAEDVLSRVLKRSDGTEYGDLLLAVYGVSAFLLTSDPDQRSKRMANFDEAQLKPADVSLLSASMDYRTDDIMTSLDWGMARFDVNTMSQQPEGESIIKGYDQLVTFLETQKKVLGS